MIRVVRATEPAELRAIRDERLALAREAIQANERIAFTEYNTVKPQLAAMQHNKCCYCEKREEQAKYRDVEHYRPKSLYWWLAWTWDNLLFSCIDCNREHKRDQFPRADGDQALAAEQPPPGAERPLVLDPSDPAVEPALHIEFRRGTIQGRERWTPYGLTDAGWRTIEVCGLARPGLLTLYKAHVDEAVRPKLEPFNAVVRQQAPASQDVFRAWETTRRGLLAPERPFRALSHDALRALTSAEIRDRYRLELPRP